MQHLSKITESLRETHGDHLRATSELWKVFHDHPRIIFQLKKKQQRRRLKNISKNLKKNERPLEIP